MTRRIRLLVAAPLLLAATPAAITVTPPERDHAARFAANMDRLIAAYPQALARHDGRLLYWKSGPPTPIAPAAPRSAQEVLASPAIADIFAWDYPRGTASVGTDPGRARPEGFFKRLYGDCRTGGVTPDLVTVRWVGGKSIRFTNRQGAAAALARVARDLEGLGPAVAQYLWPTAGTYNCRVIAGTNQLSMHSYGAAIDLNPKYGAYWRWSKRPPPAQTIPASVIAAFERHGFIWGGKWAHFDSFHFEYRPELVGG